MSDSLRDQLLGLGYKPASGKPGKYGRGKAHGRKHDARKHDARRDDPRKDDPRKDDPRNQEHKASGRGKPDRRESGRQGHKPAGLKGGTRDSRSGEMDLGKAFAIRAQVEKKERMEAERLKQEQARARREARARLAELLEGMALNDDAADIARHFEYGDKIKRVHVTASQLKALNAGELGVVQLNGRYLLVSAQVLAGAEAIFPAAVALKVDPDAPGHDDPYADPAYQVPDDLVW